MILLEGLGKSYSLAGQPVPVLRGIDLEVGAGEFVAIMGPSGSGKSTLMNILGLLDAHDEGRYTLAGRAVDGLTETEAALLRGRLIGFVFQSFHLIPHKTALENVALPLQLLGVGRRERLGRAEEALADLGLDDRLDHRPDELSGGQRQRVAIARATVAGPPLILADEPTGALDSASSDQVMGILAGLRHNGRTVIVVTHEEAVAARTERVVRLRDGRIVDDQRREVPA